MIPSKNTILIILKVFVKKIIYSGQFVHVQNVSTNTIIVQSITNFVLSWSVKKFTLPTHDPELQTIKFQTNYELDPLAKMAIES